MTEREALKLALEALKQIDEAMPFPVAKLAIMEAEKALAQPEQEPVAWRGYNWGHSPDDWVYRDFDDPILDGNGNNVGQPLYTTPPQPKEPEQEPVAYLDEGLGAFYFAKQYKKNVGFTPLYTTPPQREWVGLTDDEIDQGLLRSDYAFKTAEAWRAGVVFAMIKLKQKNGYDS